MANLNKCQVEHLLLLVGANPLPNAIAGRLLVTPNGTITLIHSQQTAPVAEKLQAWLNDRADRIELKEIQESSPGSIFQGVQDRVQAIDASCIGLNYTGGTKAMSVHAYRAVEQWAGERGYTAVFSYLDARNLNMVFSFAGDGHERREYIGRGIDLTLEELLGLHGWTLKRSSTTTPVLPDTAQTLASIHADNDTLALWQEWLQDELFWKAKKRESVRVACPRSPDSQECAAEQPAWKWLSRGKLKQILLQWPSSPELQPLVQAIKQELAQTGLLHLGEAARTCGYRDTEDFCKWLNGIWLESVVLDALHDCADSCHLHDVSMNLIPASSYDSPTSFEFDVVALRGYQLFAVSCSTDSTKSLLKSKLFEAYIRARQLGGDEARVALVSCSDDPEKIEHEMRRDMDLEGRIRAFGCKHLANLRPHLEQWIQSQSGEE